MITQRPRVTGRILALAVATFVLSGCAGQSGRPEPVAIGDRAANAALSHLGAPYRYGGSTPGGFNCSGLVHYAYAAAGKPVPRTTRALWHNADPVTDRELRRGDLLFFRFDGKMSHVGMYIGDGRFVHAPSTGRVVTVEHLRSAVYREAFIRAGRPR